MARTSGHTEPVERLGVPAVMVTDGPHGLRKQPADSDHLGLGDSVPATCFPPAAGLASSWDRRSPRPRRRGFGRRVPRPRGRGAARPGLNMKRSPLCGRNFEYFSERGRVPGRARAAPVRRRSAHRIPLVRRPPPSGRLPLRPRPLLHHLQPGRADYQGTRRRRRQRSRGVPDRDEHRCPGRRRDGPGVRPGRRGVGVPAEQELKAFVKVSLEPGDSTRVRLRLHARAFAFWHTPLRRWVTEGGAFDGESAPHHATSGSPRASNSAAKTSCPRSRRTPQRQRGSTTPWQAQGSAPSSESAGPVTCPPCSTTPSTAR